jgi:hypothetical protein
LTCIQYVVIWVFSTTKYYFDTTFRTSYRASKWRILAHRCPCALESQLPFLWNSAKIKAHTVDNHVILSRWTVGRAPSSPHIDFYSTIYLRCGLIIWTLNDAFFLAIRFM